MYLNQFRVFSYSYIYICVMNIYVHFTYLGRIFGPGYATYGEMGVFGKSDQMIKISNISNFDIISLLKTELLQNKKWIIKIAEPFVTLGFSTNFYYIYIYIVEVLLYIVLALECCSHVLNYASRWIWQAWGGEDDMRIKVCHKTQVVDSIPWAMIGCQPRSGYTSIYIHWPIHRHSWVCIELLPTLFLSASWMLAGLLSW